MNEPRKACCIKLAHSEGREPGPCWDDDAWFISSESQLSDFPIHFCPFCGKHLEPGPIQNVNLKYSYSEAREQTCPECKAEPNRSCVSDGMMMIYHHPSRYFIDPPPEF